ncbi:MAG: hypothetical protein Q4B58_06935 [Bacteroidales bacterium]|nr:hypothetical protein [Bacteroidales bacterium]
MKKALSIFVIIATQIINCNATSSNNDMDLGKKMHSIESKITVLEKENSHLAKEISNLKSDIAKSQSEIDTVNNDVKRLHNDLSAKATALGDSINTTNTKISATSETINSSISTRTLLGVVGLLLAFTIAAFVYLILKRKISSNISAIDTIKEAQTKLSEETIKLDNQLIELMDKQMDAQNSSANTAAEVDHTLALKVADEIVRIQINLSRMDASIKGYKQLQKAVERIKENFFANGYEIVDMLGKDYNEGMRVNGDFVIDETLPKGSRIITFITKPQINYCGTMIQKATITITQNI